MFCIWSEKIENLLPVQTMKAVVITSPGGPEVLKLQQVEDPIVKDHDVLIRVEATSVNRADTIQRQGKYPPPKGDSEYLGLECSGTIEAIGKNVSHRWKIGDQVSLSVNMFVDVYFVANFLLRCMCMCMCRYVVF